MRPLLSGWCIPICKIKRKPFFLHNDLPLREWFQFSLIQLADFDIQPKVDLWLLVLSLSYKVIPLGWDVFNFFSYVFAWQDKLHKRSTIFIQDFWKVFGLFHGLNCAGMAVESTLLHRFVIFLFRVCLFVQVIQWQYLSSFPVFS